MSAREQLEGKFVGSLKLDPPPPPRNPHAPVASAYYIYTRYTFRNLLPRPIVERVHAEGGTFSRLLVSYVGLRKRKHLVLYYYIRTRTHGRRLTDFFRSNLVAVQHGAGRR